MKEAPTAHITEKAESSEQDLNESCAAWNEYDPHACPLLSYGLPVPLSIQPPLCTSLLATCIWTVTLLCGIHVTAALAATLLVRPMKSSVVAAVARW